MSAPLSLQAVGLIRHDRALVHQVSLELVRGTLTCLVGPNGAGKTTLIKLAAGILPPTRGAVRLGGEAVGTLNARERARRVSWLPQHRMSAWAMRGVDIAALGQFGQGGEPYERLGARSRAAVDRALARCGATSFAHRPMIELSGGERARIHLARVLAAEAPVLLLDEPLNALDPRHQLDVMAVLREEAEAGRAVLAALHDLATARRHADRVLVMDGGRLVADGPPDTALSPGILARVFAVRDDGTGGLHPV
ncbi:MAG: ABC transporter ATP-binding protein [Glycocaulis sp.]